tara:strand:+ start:685 stop:906 length:222 start_codon:yes stop_codon:yes gene_type:complete
MNDEDENFYVEFLIEGVLKVRRDQKEATLTRLNKLFSKIIQNEDAIQITSSANLISEKNLLMALNSAHFDYEN